MAFICGFLKELLLLTMLIISWAMDFWKIIFIFSFRSAANDHFHLFRSSASYVSSKRMDNI